MEWQHHRHLVHEAEASLRQEIKANENNMVSILDDVHKQQSVLKHDVVILQGIIANPKMPPQGLSIGFHMVDLDDVSWKTAQNTGALGYMPYEHAQDYAEIYYLQDEVDKAQKQAVVDATKGAGMFSNPEFKDPQMVIEQDRSRIRAMESLQGQLFSPESLVQGMDAQYKKFLQTHPA